MKKQLTTLALACMAMLPINAQINGDGYYRIKNAITGRYMTLCDNHSKGIDYNATEAETAALETKKNKSDIISDPGSVFYIKKINGNEYNILAQGADMYSMINYYVKIIDSPYKKGAYRAYQTRSGAALYLADKYSQNDNSWVITNGYKEDERDWEIIPVSTSSDNFIGITPNIEANGKYYTAFYTGFDYKLSSADMKAYYVSKVNEKDGYAAYKEIIGTIPANTPVYIECSSKDASNNKIEPLENKAKAISGNKLTGVMFSVGNKYTGHYNSVVFKEPTMRTLNAEEGKLVLNTSTDLLSYIEVCINPGSYKDDDYTYKNTIPHNSFYLNVTEGAAKSIKVVSEEEFETTGINGVTVAGNNRTANIYNLNGIVVCKNATSTEGLAKGIYVFKGKKVVVD